MSLAEPTIDDLMEAWARDLGIDMRRGTPPPCGPHQRLFVESGHMWVRPCPDCGWCDTCWQSGPRHLPRIITGYETFCASCGRLVLAKQEAEP